jgi:hypothetical protein
MPLSSPAGHGARLEKGTQPKSPVSYGKGHYAKKTMGEAL